MLTLTDLTLSLPRTPATPLVRLTASVAAGEVLTIMGSSGAGKSTLLSALIGALDPAFTQTGRITLNGQDITGLPTADRHIGILFQDDILFPHLSVAGNLAFALPRRPGQTSAARAQVIEDGLAEMDLAGAGPRDPATLSGGQRARVALLRALLAQPKALLLDEAFSRLDTTLRGQIRRLVFDKARSLPVIMVTHDAEDARAAKGRVVTPLGEMVAV